MKKLALLAAVAALSACNEKAADTPAATDTPAAEATMADAGVTPGTYTVKMADGTTGTTVINADGTYVDTDKDGKEMRGTYARKDGKDCFDPEGDEAEMCWTVTPPGADGSFTATGADGKTTVTVTPVAATATAAATPAPAAT
jgi:hypothetical protein